VNDVKRVDACDTWLTQVGAELGLSMTASQLRQEPFLIRGVLVRLDCDTGGLPAYLVIRCLLSRPDMQTDALLEAALELNAVVYPDSGLCLGIDPDTHTLQLCQPIAWRTQDPGEAARLIVIQVHAALRWQNH